MLLQALDLLDRGLVLRIIERSPLPSEESATGVERERQERATVFPPQANIRLHEPPSLLGGIESAAGGAENGKRNTVYQVRSSQPPKSRFRDTGSSASGSNVYIVQLGAWNCSCAAFAYSAFPGGSVTGQSPWKMVYEEDTEMGREARGWEFGGFSSDGKDVGRGGVPVCKHLVACLLGERWELLREYVKERAVSREEMAGIGGEG
jgi:hypothetical protein